MTKRGDEVKVGVMVVATATLLLVTFFLMMNLNPFQTAGDKYNMHLKFAGGVTKDAVVRLAGLKCGKVIGVGLKPENAEAVEIRLLVAGGTPIRTDSIARVSSLGALGENYIEISPGTLSSPLLGPGKTIRSEETPSFSDLIVKVGAISDDATKLIGDVTKNINQISGKADTLLGNLNEVTGPQNRQNLAATIKGANGMVANANGMVTNANGIITSSSPKIDAITSNLKASTEKIDKLTANIDDAATKLNKLLANVDLTVAENRPQMKKDIEALGATLDDARKLLGDVNSLLETNRADINATVDEIRRSSENIGQFTDTVKQRPSSLIRGTAQPDRKVPKQ